MTNSVPIINSSPYIIQSREFPFDEKILPSILSKMYFEVAYAVNSRTIGIYDQFQVTTGNRWLNTGDPQNRLQSFRQVYILAALPNTATATIATGITIDTNTQFVNIYGTAESSTVSVALTPWVIGTPNDAPYIRVNRSTANIEIITTTANWIGYSATIVLEYILS